MLMWRLKFARYIMSVIIISSQIYNNHSSFLFLLVLFFNRPLLFIPGTFIYNITFRIL